VAQVVSDVITDFKYIAGGMTARAAPLVVIELFLEIYSLIVRLKLGGCAARMTSFAEADRCATGHLKR
jgi:hypothetical protein